LTNPKSFSSQLFQWFDLNQREMPWRINADPYRIWLSEIILQQTQVKQGMPYFYKFIESFPSVGDMANASEDELLKLWQGLGYYSRARYMHQTAKHIHFELNGVFPADYNNLLKLKGVGEYTAAAIASISYNEPVAVLDGNVIRVLSRLFEIQESFQSASGLKILKQTAFEVLNKVKPGKHNQAMMELGSLICKPLQPLCNICPISAHCLALKNNTILNFPIKKKKLITKSRYFNFIVPVLNADKTLLTKRLGDDIWKNMYTFPCIESMQEWSADQLCSKLSERNYSIQVELNEVTRFKHILSHRTIFASFFYIKVNKPSDLKKLVMSLLDDKLNEVNEDPVILNKQKFIRLEKSNIFEVDLKELNTIYALPRVITKYLESKEWNHNLNQKCL